MARRTERTDWLAGRLREQSGEGRPDRQAERRRRRTCSANFTQVSLGFSPTGGRERHEPRTRDTHTHTKAKINQTAHLIQKKSPIFLPRSWGSDVWIVLQNFVPVQRGPAPAGTELRGRGDYQGGPGSARRLVGRRTGWRKRMVPLKLCPGPGGKTRSSSYYLTSQLNLNIDLLKQLIYFFVKIFLLYRANVFFILLHTRTHARTHTVAEVEASRHRALEDKASIDRCANESFSRAALITLTPTFPTVRLAERLHTSSFHAHSIHILRSPLSLCVCVNPSSSLSGSLH